MPGEKFAMNVNPVNGKIKILFVSGSLKLGGAERQIIYLLKKIDRHVFTPVLCLYSRKGPLEEDLPQDIEIYDLSGKRMCLPLAVWHLLIVILKAKPAIVYSNFADINVPLFFVRLCTKLLSRKIKYVISVVNNVNFYWSTIRKLAYRFFRYMDMVFACATGVYEQLRDELKINSLKLRLLYNGVDVDYIQKRSAEQVNHPWFSDEIPVLVTVASLTPQKALDDLLKAFSIVNSVTPAHLILIGDGKLRHELETLAVELNISDIVSFVGYQSNSNKYVARADVFVLSSHWEGLATVLLEAAIVETPIVATDAPFGTSDVIRDGVTGFLVPVGDIEALSRGILTLLDDSALAEKFAKNAKHAVISKFDIGSITEEFERYCREILT